MITYLDTETTGLDPRADRLILAGFAIDAGDPVCLRHDQDADLIQSFLELDGAYCGHNIGFDMSFLEHAGYRIPDPRRWVDTVLLAHVGGERKAGQTALRRLAQKLIEEEQLPGDILAPEDAINAWLRAERRQAKKDGRRRPEKGDAPAHLLNPYLAADLTTTRSVHWRYSSATNAQRSIVELEQRCLAAVYATEQRGVPLDLDAAAELRDRTATQVGDLRAQLFELAGRAFNPNAARQIETMLSQLGADLSTVPRTPKANMPMFTADTLAAIDHPLATTLAAFRGEKKLLDYTAGLFTHAHGSRLYGTFRQMGTDTGRMSSARPNLQNIPRSTLAIRWTIAAGERYTLVGADLDSVELRVLAAYAPGGALAQAFADGISPHDQTAQAIEISRDDAKIVNYAILYGAGAPRIAQQLQVDRDQAKAILDRWYATYPEVGHLKAALARQVRRRGYLATVGGRRHYFDEPNHLLLNRFISGSCADLFKASLIELHELGVACVLYVHDEVIAEAPEHQAEQVGTQLETALTRGTDRISNLVAESESHRRWSQFNDPNYQP